MPEFESGLETVNGVRAEGRATRKLYAYLRSNLKVNLPRDHIANRHHFCYYKIYDEANLLEERICLINYSDLLKHRELRRLYKMIKIQT